MCGYIIGIFLTISAVVFPNWVAATRKLNQKFGGGWAFLTVCALLIAGILLCGVESHFTYGVGCAIVAALITGLASIILVIPVAIADSEVGAWLFYAGILAFYIWMLVLMFGEYASVFA